MSYSSEVLADSPLAYYRLDDASGTVAVDSSGNGLDATYFGSPTLGATSLLASDPSNGAVQFDGSNDRVELAMSSNITSFSVEAIIKTSTTAAMQIAGRASGASSMFYIDTSATGQPRCVAKNTAGSFAVATGPTSIADGQPHHIVGTFSGGTSGTVRLYVDGSQVATATLSFTLDGTLDIAFSVGAQGGGSGRFVNGVIDEVAYYANVELSSGRVAAHYAAAIATSTTRAISLAGVLPSTVGAFTSATEAHAALAGILPTVTAAFTLDAEADVALGGALPTVVADITLDTPSDAADLSLAGVLPTIVGDFDAEAENAGADVTLAGVLPAVVAAFTLDTPFATDTSNAADGLVLDGYATVTWEPHVVPAPETMVLAKTVMAAHAFGPVAMVGSQPVYATSTATKDRPRHRILVGGVDITYLRDVATPPLDYELAEPLLYGPATLTLPQVAACFETPGVGTLAFLAPDKAVVQQRVNADGLVIATDYLGFVVGYNISGSALVVEIGGEASGRAVLMDKQTPIFNKVQDIGKIAERAVMDLGLPFTPRYGPVTGVEIPSFGGMGHLDYINSLGAKAQKRDGTRWAIMPTADGSYSLVEKDTTTIHATAYVDDARVKPDLRRDTAEEPNRIYATTVTPAGQRVRFGVYPGLKQGPAAPYPYDDLLTAFGEGTTDADTDTGDGITVMLGRLQMLGYLTLRQTPGGYDSDVSRAIEALQEDAGQPVTGNMNAGTWGALYDLDVTGYSLEWAHIEPAAQTTQTRQWRRAASGAILGSNPNYDPSVNKRDLTVDMGSGFRREQAREFSRGKLTGGEDWVGTITLTEGAVIAGDHTPGDPITSADVMDARDLRPGMNLALPTFAGGIVVHIAQVSVSDGEAGPSFRLAVDTRARDAMEVWEVITRNRESRADPARGLSSRRRSSTMVKDSIDVWDEVGGILGTKVSCPGNEWTIFEVVAGQEGTVSQFRIRTGIDGILGLQDPAEFCVAVFGEKIGPGRLGDIVGNPLSEAGSKKWKTRAVRDELEDAGLLYVAGDHEQPCGYWPKVKSESADPDDEVGEDDPPEPPPAPLTGIWKDDAGFAYRTGQQPVLYVAIYPDRDTKIPDGWVMRQQLEAGV